jgi:hypothetical protein
VTQVYNLRKSLFFTQSPNKYKTNHQHTTDRVKKILSTRYRGSDKKQKQKKRETAIGTNQKIIQSSIILIDYMQIKKQLQSE